MAERGKVRVGNNEITRKRISAISFSIPVVIERRLRRKTRNYDEDFHHHRNEIANGKSQTFFFLLPDSLLPSWKRSRVLPSSWNHNKTEWVLDEDEEVEFIKEEGWRINLEDNLLRKFNVSIFSAFLQYNWCGGVRMEGKKIIAAAFELPQNHLRAILMRRIRLFYFKMFFLCMSMT